MSENEGTCEAMERVEEERQPEHDTPGIQLTSTLRQGALDLHARAESINSKIADLIEVGVARLDAIKESYVAQLIMIKADMEQMVESMDIEWEQKSTETIQLQKRLKAVHLLVNKFGLDTHNN